MVTLCGAAGTLRPALPTVFASRLSAVSSHIALTDWARFLHIAVKGAERMPWYMQWWVWGIAGGVVAPWLTFSKSLKVTFEEKGFLDGLGAWLGMCTLTVPVVLGIVFVFHWIAGK